MTDSNPTLKDRELAGYVGPIVRGTSETVLRRRVKTYDRETGETTGEVTMREVVGGLAKATALGLEVVEGVRPTEVLCTLCGNAVRVPPTGRVPTRCPHGGGCRVALKCRCGDGVRRPSDPVHRVRSKRSRGRWNLVCSVCFGPRCRCGAPRAHDNRLCVKCLRDAGGKSVPPRRRTPDVVTVQIETAALQATCITCPAKPKRAYLSPSQVEQRRGRPWQCWECAHPGLPRNGVGRPKRPGVALRDSEAAE